MDKVKILVVDDEAPICNMVLRFLSMNNYTADSANNGKEALELIQKNDYHLVLTDLKMPEMDGITLMKVTKGVKPDTLFIVMSGYGTLDSAIESMKLGAVNFIKKPISIIELIATIKKAEDMIMNKNYPTQMLSFIYKVEKYIELSAKELNENLEVIVSYLVSEMRVFDQSKTSIDNATMALYEALTNAIEHGSLQLDKRITRESAMEALDKLFKEKLDKFQKPQFASKKIKINIFYTDKKIEFIITDEGNGFNYKDVLSKIDDSVYNEPLNKGLFLIKHVSDELFFNNKGNEVHIVFHMNKEEKK